MSIPTKFLFERSFDDMPLIPRQADGSEVSVSVSPLTHADVELARSEGYRQGLMSGSQASKEALEHHLSAMVENLNHKLDEIISEVEHQSQQAIQAVCTMIERLFPEFSKSVAFQEVSALVESHLEQISEGTHVTISVAPSMVEPLKTRLGSRHADRIVLQASTDRLEGDCKMTWTWGGAERNSHQSLEDFLQSVRTVISRHAPPISEILEPLTQTMETSDAEEPSPSPRNET